MTLAVGVGNVRGGNSSVWKGEKRAELKTEQEAGTLSLMRSIATLGSNTAQPSARCNMRAAATNQSFRGKCPT